MATPLTTIVRDSAVEADGDLMMRGNLGRPTKRGRSPLGAPRRPRHTRTTTTRDMRGVGVSEATVRSSSSCGCEPSCGCPGEDGATQELVIVWQRLLTEGTTCPRCGTTQQAVRHAVDALAEALRPLGIRPTLEERGARSCHLRGIPWRSRTGSGSPATRWRTGWARPPAPASAARSAGTTSAAPSRSTGPRSKPCRSA